MTASRTTIAPVPATPRTSTAGKLERIGQLAAHGLNTPRLTLVPVGTPFDDELRQRLVDAARGDRLMTVRTYHPTDEITYAKGPFAPEIPLEEAIATAEELAADWNVLFQEAIDVNDTELAGNIALSRDGSGQYEALAGRHRVREVEDPPSGATLLEGSFASPDEIPEPAIRDAVRRVMRSGLLKDVGDAAQRVLLEFNVQEHPVGERREPLLFWEWRPVPAGAAAARAAPRAPSDEEGAAIGAKAAGLARARAAGLPVPPYIVLGGQEIPQRLTDELVALRSAAVDFFGDERPRSLAVRSSPMVSMPGMLDTLLHVDDDPAAVAQAIEKVRGSWESDRAVEYRHVHGIPDDAGLGVIVQPMVRADEDERGASGVGFTRNHATGEEALELELVEGGLALALVSGDAVPLTTAEVEARWPDVYRQLSGWAPVLERASRDMQEFEFAVEAGRAYLLQTRAAKRSHEAAVRVAYELARAEVIDEGRARELLEMADLSHLVRPRLSANGQVPAGTGRVASPGVAVGRAAFDREGLDRLNASGHGSILLLTVPSPDDYPTLRRAAAVVSARGGITSHASVLALGEGIPAVVSCRELAVDREGRSARLGTATVTEGDWLSVDAHEPAAVYLGQMPEIEAAVPEGLTPEAIDWARSLIGDR
jgi:phosphohistidine swiveling domain-containing protein